MEGARPVVSVVIPVRDGERFLERTLKSVLDQTFRDFEVIVIDDGSTDRSAAIATRCVDADHRVRYVEANGEGVAAARNQGIELARGNFVAPLDADDLWLPTKLERQLKRMEESDEKIGLVYCWTYLVDADDRLLAISRPFDEKTMRGLEGRVFLPMLYKSFMANGSNPLIRRSCLEAVGGYDPTLSRREDWDLSLRLADRSEFALVPSFLVAYRQLSSSRSHGERELLLSHELILERVRREHDQLPPALLRWSRSECRAYAAARCASAGRPLVALRLFGLALVLDPGQLLRPAPWQAGLQLARRLLRRRPRAQPFLDLSRPPSEQGFPMRPRRWPRVVPTPFEWLEQRRFRRLLRREQLDQRSM